MGLAAVYADEEKNQGIVAAVIQGVENIEGQYPVNNGIKTALSVLYITEKREEEMDRLIPALSKEKPLLSFLFSNITGRQPPEFYWPIIRCAALFGYKSLTNDLLNFLFYGINNKEGFVLWVNRIEKNSEVIEAVRVNDNSPFTDRWIAAMTEGIGSFWDGYGYQQENELAKAITAHKKSIRAFRKLEYYQTSWHTFILNHLALLYYSIGRYGEAEPLVKEAIVKRKELPPKGKHPDYANSLNNLATLYAEMDRYGEAEQFYKEAIAIWKELPPKEKHPDYALNLNNLAVLYESMGRYGEAEPLYKKIMSIWKEFFPKGKHPDYALSLNNLAGLYESMGRYEEAEPLYKEAIAIFKGLPPKGKHRYYAGSLNNLAALYVVMGRYGEAELLYKEALAIRKDLSPKGKHPDYAQSLNNLAALYESMGRYGEAEPLYKEALAIRKDLSPKGKHPDYAQSLNNLAALYVVMGRYGEAEPFYKKALTLTRAFLTDQFPGLSEREKSSFLSTLRYRFENIWTFAEKAYNKLPEAAELGYDALLATKAVLLDGSKKMRERILRSGNQELINTFRRWLGLKERIGRYLSGDLAALGAQTYEELEREANDLEKELSRRSEAYRRGFERKLYTWEQVQQTLGPGEAAVEFVRYEWGEGEDAEPTYAAYILRGDRKNVDLVVFPEGETMEGEALAMYRGLTAPTKAGLLEYLMDGRDPEQEVHNAYWAPLGIALEGIKRVYLSPDGVYNLINLGTVKGEKGYLSDTVDLRILTTTRTLVERMEEAASTEGGETAEAAVQSIPALMGYPAYGLGVSEQESLAQLVKERAGGEKLASRDSGFGEVDFRGGVSVLPGTKEEVEAITALYESFGKKAESYLWDEALEEQVKVLKSPKVLHIATHGFFEEDGSWLVKKASAPGEMLAAGEEAYEAVSHPLMQSGLLLAGCEDTLRGGTEELEDGILTAYEAMSLDLDNTDLVVLSACETGRGEILNGEGVYGLQRAFQVAGAKAVIMSLWKVDDEATKDFMITFYRNYLSGGDSRAAYLETVREMRGRYRDPFYWGAFVYVE